MLNYDTNQKFIFNEALNLAVNGEEFSHLCKILNPEFALRLRIYVQQLPEEIRMKTIYGRAVSKGSPAPKGKK